MADISKVVLPNSSEYNVKDTVARSMPSAYYGTCATAAATAAKVVTVSSDQNFHLMAGVVIGIKFSVSNTADNVTFNVNNTGAKPLWYNTAVYNGHDTGVTGYANRTIYYMYDWSHWVHLSYGYNTNGNTVPTAYSTTAAGTAAKTATCTNYNLLAKSYTILLISTTNTAASALTLNINGKGAKPIYINGTASSASNHTMPAGSYLVYYDGTNYYIRTDGKITGSITGDAATVNGKTVGVNVPANAKFTDTVVTKTSELTNDSHFAVDANYIHTDNNFTTTEKNKLANISSGAEVNVQSDWNETDTSSDSYILNKPAIKSYSAGTNIQISDDGVISATDSTYPTAITNITRSGTTFTATRADGTTFTFTQQDNNSLTGVKGNAESSYRTGNVNLTPANIGAVDKTGDTMTGNLLVAGTAKSPWVGAKSPNGLQIILNASDNSNRIGLWDTFNGNWLIYRQYTHGVAGDNYVLGHTEFQSSSTTGQLDLYNTTAKKHSYVGTSDNGHLWLVTAGYTTTVDVGGNYVNLRVSNQAQVRNTGDTGWKPIAASAFNVNSTRRVKENIQPILDERAGKLLDVDVVTYDYKKNVVDDNDRYNRTGVIAEDVDKIIPEVVKYGEDGKPEMVDYSRFVPYLIRMVQIQQKQIEELKLLINERRD